MTRYLLNSAVLTGEGTYTYRLITEKEAVAWLQKNNFVSRIGYPATAKHIESISGVLPEVSRDKTEMQPGDEALIIRLKYRVADPSQKANHNHIPDPDDYEYGLLKARKINKEE